MQLFHYRKALIALCVFSIAHNIIGQESNQSGGSYAQLSGSASYPSLPSLARSSSLGDSLVVPVKGEDEVRMTQPAAPVKKKKTKKRPSRCCRITKWVTGLCVLGLTTYGGYCLSKEGWVVYGECMRAKNSLGEVNNQLSLCLSDAQIAQKDALAAFAAAERAAAACAKCVPAGSSNNIAW